MWWKTAVIYQVYPRSFADANGDGVGDLDGIRQHLDYLKWLGIDAIWTSPICKSPMADFGYDVSDYTDVDPIFGDLNKFDAYVTAAHDHGIKVMLDWVPNHSSDQHPWFVESRSSKESPKRDWYIWRDGKDGQLPNNWRSHFLGQPAWTLDETTQQYYLHLFLKEQPDLNWSNPDVEHAMHDTLRFWLDRGVDGFRADVVHLIGKDEALTDVPASRLDEYMCGFYDQPEAHAFLRGVRRVLDEYSDRAIVGEVNLETPRQLVPYYGKSDELHLVFNFAMVRVEWRAEAWLKKVIEAETALAEDHMWPVWVFSNHDEQRHRTRFGGSETRARITALVLLTLRGTPFMYAGEELGLLDANVTELEQVDPGGRDGCRAPIPWDASDQHGWSAKPWLPFAPNADTANVESQQTNEKSILHLYRHLLAARRSSTALQLGSWSALDAPADHLAYERVYGDEAKRVVANFGSVPSTAMNFDGHWEIEIGTDLKRCGEPWNGELQGEEGVLLKRV